MFEPPQGKVPEEIAREFNAIRMAVADLHSIWKIYAEVFGNKQYAALIDEWAAAPFLLIHRAMRCDILVSFGRLLDPPTKKKMGGIVLQNLSFAHLLKVVQTHCHDQAFHSKLAHLLADAETHCEPLRKWRDKRFGHADRDHTPPLGTEMLPNVDEMQIEEALLKLESILKEIHSYFNGPDAEFLFPVLKDCAGQLMRLIEDGVNFRQAEIDEMGP